MESGLSGIECVTGRQNIWKTYFVLESLRPEHLDNAQTTRGILADAANLQIQVPLQRKDTVFCISIYLHGFSQAPWTAECDS